MVEYFWDKIYEGEVGCYVVLFLCNLYEFEFMDVYCKGIL